MSEAVECTQPPGLQLPPPEAIPAELRERAQWVAWTYGHDGRKLPLDPHTGRAASTTDPATWAPFATAYTFAKRRGCGVGFVFTPDDPYTGVDFDDCRSPGTGAIRAEVWPLIERLASYTEVSPSGRGVKAICRAKLPRSIKRPGLEVYSAGRFFTITGQAVPGLPTTIENRQAELEALVAEVAGDNGHGTEPLPEVIPEGARNSTLASLAGSLRRRGASEAAILAALREVNAAQCDPPLPVAEVEAIAKSVARYEPAPRPTVPQPQEADDTDTVVPWPDPLDEAAFYGLAGEVVGALEPQTEADPAALLVQLLVAFGNAVGRAPFYPVEASQHHTNLFAVLVGATSKGRKGTAWDHIAYLMSHADPVWATRVQEGLSSGEGLIWAVRDPILTREPVKEKGHVVAYEEVETDPGVADKRLLVTETEFCSVLKLAQREGNTLSATIRKAWDTGSLRILNKNSPAQATGAHISIIGHITRDELLRHLEGTEAANGFANRFLWVAVRRSKCLPDGGDIGAIDTTPLVAALRNALDFGRKVGRMQRDDEARAIWHAVYPDLSDGKPGLFGAVTSRAEAQVLRLSCVYALLDCSPVVRREHLLAALAVWEYCEASARWVFGDKLGDPTADEILRALRENRAGMTRTEISALFGRNKSAGQISRALAALLEAGRVRKTVLPADDTGGRPAELWQAT